MFISSIFHFEKQNMSWFFYNHLLFYCLLAICSFPILLSRPSASLNVAQLRLIVIDNKTLIWWNYIKLQNISEQTSLRNEESVEPMMTEPHCSRAASKWRAEDWSRKGSCVSVRALTVDGGGSLGGFEGQEEALNVWKLSEQTRSPAPWPLGPGWKEIWKVLTKF